MEPDPPRVSVRPPADAVEPLRRLAREAGGARPRRAVVLAGGGAKGVFESGVLHALVQVDLDVDVITGSSVGALNAVAYAEVLRARRLESEEAAAAALERTLELWQRLDRERVADLDAWGWRVWALGLGLPALGALLLWIALAGSAGLPGRVAAGVLGLSVAAAGLALVRGWLRLPALLRARVRGGLGGPARRRGQARRSGLETLLALAGLTPSLFPSRGLRRALARVVPAGRRLSEYRACGLDVRLTRTNLRTGRTEISEHLTAAEADAAGVDRGRRVPGDPRAAAAALASCAFPAAFPPVEAAELYPRQENEALYARLAARAQAKHELQRLFGPRSRDEYLWLMGVLDELGEREPGLLRAGGEAELWRRLKARFVGERASWTRFNGRALFTLVETRAWPQLPLEGESAYGDRYFDGGILDNTPLSTALAALREAEARGGAGAGEAPVHEVFVVLLSPRPRQRYLSARAAERLAGPALGLRALRLQAEQRLADDVRTAEKFDRLLEQKAEAEHAMAGRTPAAGAGPASPEAAPAPAAGSWAELLAREESGAAGPSPLLASALEPERFVRAAVTRIQPSWDLPWVLALDDRLGFDGALARDFQVRGCRDALQALHARYAPAAVAGALLPLHARAARRLLGGSWEEAPGAGWRCQIERCSLRETCDRVAEREAAAADPRVAAPAAV